MGQRERVKTQAGDTQHSVLASCVSCQCFHSFSLTNFPYVSLTYFHLFSDPACSLHRPSLVLSSWRPCLAIAVALMCNSGGCNSENTFEREVRRFWLRPCWAFIRSAVPWCKHCRFLLCLPTLSTMTAVPNHSECRRSLTLLHTIHDLIVFMTSK